MSFQTQYHEDSDADDEYERSVVASPQLPTDSEISPTDSESLSAEHTPTTYGNSGEDHGSPRTIITEWTAEECADFVTGLGLRQYRNAFLGLSSSTRRVACCWSDIVQKTKLSEKHLWP